MTDNSNNDNEVNSVEASLGYMPGKMPKEERDAAHALLRIFVPVQDVISVLAARNQGGKGLKRKAEDALSLKKTKFLITYRDGNNDLATSLDFEEEPSAEELWSKYKAESPMDYALPLFYYSTGNNYCRVPEKGKLPESMLVDEAKGTVDLVVAAATPTKPPEKAEQLSRMEPRDFGRRLSKEFVKSLSPNIKPAFFSSKIRDIPILFDDEIIRNLEQTLGKPPEEMDAKICVLFAVPGAGKSRTITESCKRYADLDFTREKLSDGVLLKKFEAIADEKKDEFPSASYADIKKWFLPAAEAYIYDLKNANPNIKVIHFDEVQQLMGYCMVSSDNFDSVRLQATMEDFFMPAFCEGIHLFASQKENPSIIMSGTNFFSPLTFNPGSSMKVNDDLYLHGRFPKRWVIEQLLHKFFHLKVLEEDPVSKFAFENIVDYVSANRRVVEFFLENLRKTMMKKMNKLTKEELLVELGICKDAAVNKWTKGCLTFTSASCMTALALCVHPEAYGGEVCEVENCFPEEYNDECPKIKVVVLEKADLPNDVQIYANAGGLNIWTKSDTKVAVEIPVGCLRANLLTRCHGLSRTNNAADMDAIQNYRRKVDPNAKGHLFERALAFELTTFGSKIGDLICETLTTSDRSMVMDGRIFGSDWVNEPLIVEKWKDGKMHCVFEKAKDTGARIVDVGFPVVNVAPDKAENWRVYCELKCGYTNGNLWKLCAQFLEVISPRLQAEQHSCAIFIASKSFLDAQVEVGREPHKKKVFVTTHELYGERFFILDSSALAGKSVLNLSEMHEDRDDSDLGYSLVASQVSKEHRYASDSQAQM